MTAPDPIPPAPRATAESAAVPASPRRRHPIRRLAIFLLALYAVLAGCAMSFEDRIIFQPSKFPDGWWDATKLTGRPGEAYPKIEDCQFAAADGVKLHGWYATPWRGSGAGGVGSGGAGERVPAQMVLLWCHGNAGNLSYRYEMLHDLMKLPVEVFIFDYRGYGKSEGTPSEGGVYQDAQAAWAYLTQTRGRKPGEIVIFGKSLGGAAAIDLALHLQQEGVRPAGLIVQSSFTSIPDMAGPLRILMPGSLFYTKMDSLTKVKSITCPKLFIHSPADEVVPYRQGRKLFEAAAEPKQFYEVAGAGHNETWRVGGAAYLEALRGFLTKARPEQ